LIATPKGFTILALQLVRNIRAAVLIAVVGVGPAVVVIVLPRAIHTILKAAALNLAATFLIHIPSALRFMHLRLRWAHGLCRAAHQVSHTAFVAATKSFAVRFSHSPRNTGMTILVAVVHIRPAVVVKIPARAFDAVMKAAALHFLPLLRRRIPRAAFLSIPSRG
jgi:hypothetical protein